MFDVNSRLVIGHTGWIALYPQNTLLAFSKAIEAGVDIVECDVRLTQDNVWVLMHEYDLSVRTNGTGHVHNKTWNEVKELDAGYVFNSGQYANQEDTKVPSLSQLIDLVSGTNVKIMLDLKQWQWNPYLDTSQKISQMTSLVNLLSNEGILEQCIFTSDEAVCNDFKDNFPNSITAPYYYSEEYFNSNYAGALQNAIAKGHEIVTWNDGVYDEYPNTYVTREMVKAFHNAGIMFGVTTITNRSPGGYYKTKVYMKLGVNYYLVDHINASINAITDGIEIPISTPVPDLWRSGILPADVVIFDDGKLRKVDVVSNVNGTMVKHNVTADV